MTPAIESSPATSERASIRLLTPDPYYLNAEPITLFVYPPAAAQFDVRIVDAHRQEVSRTITTTTRLDLKAGLPIGRYNATVRWSASADQDATFSEWSVPCPIDVRPATETDSVLALRVLSHRHALMSTRDINGILTITDPWALPPEFPAAGPNPKWFRTPVYEGATTLLNESAAYFEDPLRYLLDAVESMLADGVGFRTWHDLLDGRSGQQPTEALLQFDVDGGQQSITRIIEPLMQMGVQATLMIHRAAYDWYEYPVEDLPLDLFRAAEQAGWTIGYHNNAIGNTQRPDRFGDYGSAVLAEAAEQFRDDVAHLRTLFTIRSWTAHGGNVLNHRLDTPDGLDITCVDRTNQALWKSIRSMFSDGGFASRPCPLEEKITKLSRGVHFFRLHPIKYGNYVAPWDTPPLVADNIPTTDEPDTAELDVWRNREIDKQTRWLEHRRRFRLGRVFSHASPDKPLRSRFRDEPDVHAMVARFRERRTPYFKREYPETEGDPRVFWWRLINACAPESGELLNVGALPPDRRDETTDFLSPDVSVIEMDIDADRSPHILGDIAEAGAELNDRFSGVMLFGLPYVHSPRRAIDACRRVVTPGGIGLFGFPDDTHPMRGALWNPITRPSWRPELEPLEGIGLKGKLWSFDPDAVSLLFREWNDVAVENISHYWFVAARGPS